MDALEKFRGTITGTVFVLGAGPSLRNLPDKLKGTVIAVNSAILKYPDADFYFSCDARVIARSHWLKALANMRVNYILSKSFLEDKEGIKRRAELSDSDSAPEQTYSFDQEVPFTALKLNPYATKLIRGGSSVHAATHFAMVLGAATIVLIGCDCCSVEGKRYFTEFPGQPTDDFSPLIKKWDNSEAHVKGFNIRWDAVATANPKANILNASDGALKCFKRVNIKDYKG